MHAAAVDIDGLMVAWSEYRLRRRVNFYETDCAGIVHFSWFFSYLEEAEHAMWRAAGLSIAPAAGGVGFPRVNASFDYHRPLRFEDEFEVAGPRGRDRPVEHALRLRDHDGRRSASPPAPPPSCAWSRTPAGMKSAPFPEDVISRFEVAPPSPPDMTHRDAGPHAPWPRSRASACWPCCAPLIGPERLLHAQAQRRARATCAALRLPEDLARLPFTTKAELVADQEANGALGHQPHRAAERLHALLPDVVHHRPAAPLARHQRQLAVDARLLEDGLPARRTSGRATGCSFRSRSGRSSGSGPASRPGRRWGCTACRAAACPRTCG